MANGRTIYLHIGTEKTGTTTLQAMFSTNREVLAKAGILYPTTLGKVNLAGLAVYALPQNGRHDLAAMLQLTTPAEMADYRARFAVEFAAEIERSGCKDIVISNEHLSSRLRQPEAIARAFALLRKLADTIKVIVYLRPQYELAPSSYSTSVKCGSIEPFSPPGREKAYYYNYDMLLRNWEEHAGRDHVIVRRFSRGTFKNQSLIEDIFDAMALPMPPGLVPATDKNRSLSAQALEFMRVANRHISRREGGRRNPDHTALVKYLTSLGSDPKFTIAPDMVLAIEKMFQASNQAVADRYFPEQGGLLFPPARIADAPFSPAPAKALIEIGVNIWTARHRLAKLGGGKAAGQKARKMRVSEGSA